MTFRPTIDWSHELLNSTLWVTQTFVITAPCLLVVLVLVGRITKWGRQFWRTWLGWSTTTRAPARSLR